MKMSNFLSVVMSVVAVTSFHAVANAGSSSEAQLKELTDGAKFIHESYSNSVGSTATQKDRDLISRIEAKLGGQKCRTKEGALLAGSVILGRHDQINTLKVSGHNILMVSQMGSLNDTANEVYEDPSFYVIALSDDDSKITSITIQDLAVKKIPATGSLLRDTPRDQVAVALKNSGSTVQVTCK